ncbi:MAG TPA: bifunctional UDP-sugar hydrolase/5'-nucleotidase [Smithella sp.]|nr:bifunctional UDP-sugar hydrolase/5'-nucleotidase [Smithella sp.]HOX97979.1 bifunctional UDP-sugar hydrolase/5'-nucleotidase [Smithella sp.]HPH54654.1 bifunctional UDP-sugar hydrolase/5'-nucleotidase [Smithella sp.]HPN85771.1 bifunctional UDP-sugar hydrolase/5'-nucleotidase [Smithella sp.]HPX29849.1 bifunctional UDP-sugar hydrolase/5'-nucleotidase [Smithella sp.]
MKKIFLQFFLLLVLFGLLPVAGIFNPVAAEESARNASGNQTEIDLMLLFTNDLHSYFLPHRVLTEDGRQTVQGGYARLACMINEQRRLHPAKTLLVDAGDFSMGTLFHTAFMTEAFELRLMGKMGYAATTLGNHDFDFHPEGLAKMLTAARSKSQILPQIVASNLIVNGDHPGDKTLKQALNDYPVRDYMVLERNGLRIGLFGIMGKDAADDAPFAKPVMFADPVEASKKTVAILKNREKADLVICLSHSGTSADAKKSEDEILARAVPQIDVIVSGHTHTVLKTPIIIGRTIIVSGGRYGRYLGSLGIRFDRFKGASLASYDLRHVSSEIPEDKAVQEAIAGYEKIVNRDFLAHYDLTFEDVIAESDFSMESLESMHRHPRETGLGNLIVDAYREAVKQAEGPDYRHVHFALQPLGVIRDSLLKGKITVSDVFRVLSLGIGPDRIPGYPLVSFYISGKELKDILEVHTTIAPMHKKDAYLQVSGVKFTYNPRRIWFDRVTSVWVADEKGVYQPLDQTKLYRACANLYTAALIDYVSSVSFGLIHVVPKDSSGKRLTDLNSSIVSMKKTGEIKEWLALALYLRSFQEPQHLQTAKIPLKYSKPEGRYLAQPSCNPVRIFSKGNILTKVFLVSVILLLMICGLIVYVFVKKMKKISKKNPR